MWQAQLQHAGSSWLVHCSQHTTSRCRANAQLVPQIRCGASSLQHSAVAVQPVVQPVVPRQGWRHAAAPSVCRAAAPAASHVELEDATEARLYALYDFVNASGRLPQVQDQHKGVAVGQWSEQCKQLHQQQQLDPQLSAALETVPGWDWQPQVKALAGSFEDSICMLQRFQQLHGRLPKSRSTKRTEDAGASFEANDTAVPKSRIIKRTADNAGASFEALGTAVCRQLMGQRKRGVLTQQQIDRVSSSLPGWRWDLRVRSPPLDAVIRHLQQFVEQHGRLPRLHEKLADGFLLGEWCTARRSEFNKGQLETDVAAALAAGVPGWSWNLDATAFEANLRVLRQFAVIHGRMPAQRETCEGVRIGAWCNKRRLQYKQGCMPADRAAALEGVEGWWWSAEDMPGC